MSASLTSRDLEPLAPFRVAGRFESGWAFRLPCWPSLGTGVLPSTPRQWQALLPGAFSSPQLCLSGQRCLAGAQRDTGTAIVVRTGEDPQLELCACGVAVLVCSSIRPISPAAVRPSGAFSKIAAEAVAMTTPAAEREQIRALTNKPAFVRKARRETPSLAQGMDGTNAVRRGGKSNRESGNVWETCAKNYNARLQNSLAKEASVTRAKVGYQEQLEPVDCRSGL